MFGRDLRFAENICPWREFHLFQVVDFFNELLGRREVSLDINKSSVTCEFYLQSESRVRSSNAKCAGIRTAVSARINVYLEFKFITTEFNCRRVLRGIILQVVIGTRPVGAEMNGTLKSSRELSYEVIKSISFSRGI